MNDEKNLSRKSFVEKKLNNLEKSMNDFLMVLMDLDDDDHDNLDLS